MNTESQDAIVDEAHENRLTLLRTVYREGPQPLTGRLFDLLFSDTLVETWCRLVGLRYEIASKDDPEEPTSYMFSVDEEQGEPETETIEDIDDEDLID